ncbi:GntR family transcriptional regulator [Variovorax dokdonensis]|uniref:GntR family transcriptional regulator n=1 Tax=Variovorax dokdonensis TaxID=344883 RepID=A0ABT7NAS5_9BURK|nr:GntR family transcriptional regulator [Variovorax dokdonensis]MDM0045034.1 GntR family transcriptional regulator [Variovorax dokdonensis]
MGKPQSPESLSDTVRAEMERDLLNGQLIPGTVLDERSLAERFGVSRTPVREAVLFMAAQGLLNVIPRVGVVVPKLGIKELLGLLEMLAEMEGVCAKFAAKRMDAGQREEFRSALKACRSAAKSGNRQGYAEANARFHAAIYSGARNEWAARQVMALRLRCAAYQQSRFDLPGRLLKSLGEHEKIAAAIESGDAEAARAAMQEHISVGGQDFAEFVSSLNPNLLADPH